MRNPMKKCLAAILLAAVLLVPAYRFLRNASLAASQERTVQRKTQGDGPFVLMQQCTGLFFGRRNDRYRFCGGSHRA